VDYNNYFNNFPNSMCAVPHNITHLISFSWIGTNVLEERGASIFRVQKWVSPECLYRSTRFSGITLLLTIMFVVIVNDVRSHMLKVLHIM
jgi:hypothetical protein